MSGCDYLASLPGIGLGKAYKFWSKVHNTNLTQVLPRIPTYLNMPKLVVDAVYIADFIRADLTFRHQIVFDPESRLQRPLQDYAKHERQPDDMSFAGTIVDNARLALAVARGLCPLHGNLSASDVSVDIEPRVYKGQTPFGPCISGQPSIWTRTSRYLDFRVEQRHKSRQKQACSTDIFASNRSPPTSKSCASLTKHLQARNANPAPPIDRQSEASEDVIVVSKYFANKSRAATTDAGAERQNECDTAAPTASIANAINQFATAVVNSDDVSRDIVNDTAILKSIESENDSNCALPTQNEGAIDEKKDHKTTTINPFVLSKDNGDQESKVNPTTGNGGKFTSILNEMVQKSSTTTTSGAVSDDDDVIVAMQVSKVESTLKSPILKRRRGNNVASGVVLKRSAGGVRKKGSGDDGKQMHVMQNFFSSTTRRRKSNEGGTDVDSCQRGLTLINDLINRC